MGSRRKRKVLQTGIRMRGMYDPKVPTKTMTASCSISLREQQRIVKSKDGRNVDLNRQ